MMRIISKVVVLLKEYIDIFPKIFLEMKWIKGNLGEM